MKGIASLMGDKSSIETYKTPICKTMELHCEGLLCTSPGLITPGHNGFVDNDYNDGWDD